MSRNRANESRGSRNRGVQPRVAPPRTTSRAPRREGATRANAVATVGATVGASVMLGDLVGFARLRHGLTRRDLGRILGRDASNLKAAYPKFDVAVRLAEVLEWPLPTIAAALGVRGIDDRSAGRSQLVGAAAAMAATGAPTGAPTGARPGESLGRAETESGAEPVPLTREEHVLESLRHGWPARTVKLVRQLTEDERDGGTSELLLAWSMALCDLERDFEAAAIAEVLVRRSQQSMSRARQRRSHCATDLRCVAVAASLRELMDVRCSLCMDIESWPPPRLRPKRDRGERSKGSGGESVQTRRRRRGMRDDAIVRWIGGVVEMEIAAFRDLFEVAPKRGHRAEGRWLLAHVDALMGGVESSPAPAPALAPALADDAIIDLTTNDAARLSVAVAVIEAFVAGQCRAYESIDMRLLRDLGRWTQRLLAIAVRADAPMRWPARMRAVRAEVRRRELIMQASGVAIPWPLFPEQERLVIELVGRFPSCRELGLQLLCQHASRR